jgi:hypothetical protein
MKCHSSTSNIQSTIVTDYSSLASLMINRELSLQSLTSVKTNQQLYSWRSLRHFAINQRDPACRDGPR